MVGLYDNILKKSILIGSSTTAINPPNSTDSAHLKETLIIDGGENNLVSTSQAHYFGMITHKVENNHSEKQYIHLGDWFISMESVSINYALKVNVI